MGRTHNQLQSIFRERLPSSTGLPTEGSGDGMDMRGGQGLLIERQTPLQIKKRYSPNFRLLKVSRVPIQFLLHEENPKTRKERISHSSLKQ
jgi:hypothetical protein